MDQLCLDEHANCWTCGIEARDRLVAHIRGHAIRCTISGTDIYGRSVADCQFGAEDLNASCFDRETGLPVASNALKSFKQVIALYHLHPELKFLNGDYLDRGVTQRRRIHAIAVRNIGKEANEWEEQYYLGFDEEEQIDYGLAPRSSTIALGRLRRQIKATGQRRVARESGLARRTIEHIMRGGKPRSGTLVRIRRAIANLEQRPMGRSKDRFLEMTGRFRIGEPEALFKMRVEKFRGWKSICALTGNLTRMKPKRCSVAYASDKQACHRFRSDPKSGEFIADSSPLGLL